ncbi:MAG TPA: hypothetical protein PKL30_24320 [Leptospiraceae bacterium]|nr:hypothetical protein [Leptospiraceae bacterium]HMW08352.1 hypothetical protein [Leptospiraceae bacterium]HMY34321.1 hypothetical protein [Leptospiraceae bacterium]HMZ67515.1 hypothetical protein [Leptospiraceae bacterium]HNA10486.1 hypothetical protein [Leptospiraceae bacterium]
MNQIKFSHEYFKLGNIEQDHPVQLVEVFQKPTEEFSDEFKEYDTAYYDGKTIANYPLGKGLHLILLFRDSKGNLFTTVRRFTHEKFVYYNNNRGKQFSIVFT